MFERVKKREMGFSTVYSIERLTGYARSSENYIFLIRKLWNYVIEISPRLNRGAHES